MLANKMLNVFHMGTISLEEDHKENDTLKKGGFVI